MIDNILHEPKLLAQVLDTTSGISTSSLGQDRLPLVRSQPSCKWLKRLCNVISDALSGFATFVSVEILVDVEDQVGEASVGVFDFG